MRYLGLILILGCCQVVLGQDTLMSPNYVQAYPPDTILLAANVKIPARILQITALGVKYNNLASADKRVSFIAMNKIIMIRYHDGHVAMQIDLLEDDNGWRDRRSSFGATYDSLMHIRNKNYAIGAGLTTTGAVAVAVGFGCLAGLTAPIGLQISGLCIMSAGVGILVVGIVELALAVKYRRAALSYRNGLVFITYPQPGFMLPTAQNNFEKGLMLHTGITF